MTVQERVEFLKIAWIVIKNISYVASVFAVFTIFSINDKLGQIIKRLEK
jgi:hypothetical protein